MGTRGNFSIYSFANVSCEFQPGCPLSGAFPKHLIFGVHGGFAAVNRGADCVTAIMFLEMAVELTN